VIRGFYEQVRGEEPRPWGATLEEGAHGMRLVEAILASHRSERWARLEA
jgi:predicted dehydrogenase